MSSLWLDRPTTDLVDEFPEDGWFDVLVVGAGLTGLVTAVLLARSGQRVGVLEARQVGGVTTSRTSAKVSLLQGTKLSGLLGHHSERVARGYLEANRAGQDWLLGFCAAQEVAVQRREAVTYAPGEDDVATVRREHDAALTLGLDVAWRDILGLPFPSAGGVVLADQAQLDPVELTRALAAEVRRHGGTLHEGQRLLGVGRPGRPEVRLDSGRVLRARTVVLATGTPVLDRG